MKKKLVKKRRRIKRPSSGKKPYFTKDTQAAIHKFCEAESVEDREKIYSVEIRPALEKLAENLIFIYGFHKQHDDIPYLKHQCVVNLYETLHKFDHTRGSNAFSYFNVVAKNWLIIHTRRCNRYKNRTISFDDPDQNLNIDGIMYDSGKVSPPPESYMMKEEKIEDIRKMLYNIKERVKSDHELRCMVAIITIFENLDDLDFLNKRALFVYVRELSGLNSKQLSVCMSNIRRLYRQICGPDKEFDIL